MKTLSENDQRGSAMFGIVVCMGTLFIACISSNETSSMICFCIACTAMLSMMQLASVSNPNFAQRYRFMFYFFALAPVAFSMIHLFRERARIFDNYMTIFFAIVPVLIFVLSYTWYIKTHGVDSIPESDGTLNQTEEKALDKD